MSAHINQQTIEDLKMLEEDGEPSFLIDLIETLLKTSPAKLVNIENFLSANDLVAAAKESHSLKSSVRALGADILGGICQRLEDLKSTTNFDDAKKIFVELKAEYEVIAQELTSIKDNLK